MLRVLLLILLLPVCAAAAEPQSTMTFGQQVEPPFGFTVMCVRQPEECEGGTDTPRVAEMTPAAWAELVEVNEYVNALPRRDEPFDTDFWQAGPGDCEDLVLEKRRRLMARGWPAEALLIALVREWTGDAHAVLLVLTDAGAFVADSKNRFIDRAGDAPYGWIKVQSPRRPYVWLSTQTGSGAGPYYPPLGEPAPFLAAISKAGRR